MNRFLVLAHFGKQLHLLHLRGKRGVDRVSQYQLHRRTRQNKALLSILHFHAVLEPVRIVPRGIGFA